MARRADITPAAFLEGSMGPALINNIMRLGNFFSILVILDIVNTFIIEIALFPGYPFV